MSLIVAIMASLAAFFFSWGCHRIAGQIAEFAEPFLLALEGVLVSEQTEFDLGPEDAIRFFLRLFPDKPLTSLLRGFSESDGNGPGINYNLELWFARNFDQLAVEGHLYDRRAGLGDVSRSIFLRSSDVKFARSWS
jgi:hypothetical protein